MKISKDFIRRALAGDVACGKVLAPVVRRCAGAGCSQVKAHDHVDDVEQELWIFLTKHTDRLDDDYNIEPYLIKTAMNIARAYLRKFAFYGTDGEDSRAEGVADGDGGVSAQEEASSDLAEKTDQQAALDYLLSRSPAMREALSKEADNNFMNRVRSNNAAEAPKYTRSHEQDALRRLRENAGLTQAAMATRLGLKLPTYQAYEYGRTKGVPKQVMDAAKNLTVDPQHSYVLAMYGGRPMRDIALEWSRRMGIDEDKPGELAEALGIDKSNASRWLNPNGKVQLSPDDLIMYERRVAREEAYARSSKKRRARLKGDHTIEA